MFQTTSPLSKPCSCVLHISSVIQLLWSLPHVLTEGSRTELRMNKLGTLFKFYFWILQPIISYVRGSQKSCTPSRSKAVNRIKQSNESVSQTVSTATTAAQFYSLLRKGPWVKNIPPKYLVKKQTEVTEVFYSNEEWHNFPSNLHCCHKKQTSASFSEAVREVSKSKNRLHIQKLYWDQTITWEHVLEQQRGTC